MKCSGTVSGPEDAPSSSADNFPHTERDASLASDPDVSDSPSSKVQSPEIPQEKTGEKSTAWSDFIVRVRKHLRGKADKDLHPGGSEQISKTSPEVDDASHFLKELQLYPNDKRHEERSEPLDLVTRSESDSAEGSNSGAESNSVFMSKQFVERNFAVDARLMGRNTPDPPEPASEPNFGSPISQDGSVVAHADISLEDVVRRIESSAKETDEAKNDVDCDDTESALGAASELEDSSPPDVNSKSSPEEHCDEELSSPIDLSQQASSESLEVPDAWAELPSKPTSEEYNLQDERSKSHRYLCALCEREFYEKVGLDKHVCADIDEKPFSCDFCGNSFSMKNSLKIHVSLHTGRKPHFCTTCGKSFLYESILKRHMAKHTGEESHRCTICLKSFASVLGAENHMLVHYEENMQPCGVHKADIKEQDCIQKEDANSNVSSGDASTEESRSEKHEFLPTAEEQLQCAVSRKDDMKRHGG